jgi:tRNA-Thr(GGU) m(6)t(6)A37 methyltransferase TsaA
MKQKSWTDKKSEVRFIGKVVNIEGETAVLQVYPQYCDGLKDIGSYSHLIILYWAHHRDNEDERQTLLVYPKRHGRKVETGVFACRSPSRPNPICLCIVELLEIEDCSLKVRRLDAELGSPIVDIKPYHPHSDSIPDARFPEWVRERETPRRSY